MCRPITYLEDVSTSGLPHAEPHHVHHTSSSCDDLGPHVRELSDEPRAGRTDAHTMHDSHIRAQGGHSYPVSSGLAWLREWATN